MRYFTANISFNLLVKEFLKSVNKRQNRSVILLLTSFVLMTDRLTPSVIDRLLIMYCILLQHLCLSYSSCVQLIMGYYMAL